MTDYPASQSLSLVPASGSHALAEPGGFANVFPGASRDVELRVLWRGLWRRRKLIAAVFLAFFAMIALFTFLQPRQYTTQVKMIPGKTGGTGTTGGDNTTELPVLNALLAQSGVQNAETYAELLQEAPIAQAVIDRLRLKTGPGSLLGHVAIRPVTNTDIISVAVSWPDRVLSAQITNAFAEVFVDHERKMISNQADTIIASLQGELPQAEARMRASQNTLAAYQARTGLADLATQTQTDIAALAQLDAKAQTADLDSRQAQAQLAAVNGQLASTPQQIQGARSTAPNPVAAQLSQQIAQAQVDLATARQQYTDRHPTVIALRHRVDHLRSALRAQQTTMVSQSESVPNPLYEQLMQQKASLESQIASAQSQLQTVNRQRTAAKPALNNLPEQTRRIGDLQREVKSSEGVYSALQQRYQDALIARTTALSDVTITQPADPNDATVTPNVTFNLMIGLLVGLILAISTALVVEFFDDRFRSEEDVKDRLGLPVLATIPQLDLSDAKESSWVQPMSVEAFFQLVASLRYSSNRPPRTIAITSPMQADGKSTVAVNTAVSMASLNARVLLIDADLRRPTVHEKLGISNERGLSDVLVDVLPLAEAVRPSGHDGVWVLTSGKRPPNPIALLQSIRFDRVLSEARDQFDMVIVDTPALRSIIDSVVIGIKTEGTIMVVSATKSDTRAVKTGLAKLRGVHGLNLLGVVLNEVKPDVAEYSDYYLGGGHSLTLPALAKR